MEKSPDESVRLLLLESPGESPIEAREIHDDHAYRRPSTHWSKGIRSLASIFMLCLIALALVVDIIVRLRSMGTRAMPSSHTSLVGDRLRYEERLEWYPPTSPFDEEPSDELDAAWDELLYAINIRVTETELRHLGSNLTNRVKVNGGDYIGSMGVYHHLHCLNMLRMIVHRDYYEPRWAEYPYLQQFGIEHSDHCINALRQAVMCQPNLAITTFEWVSKEVSPNEKLQKLETATTCTNWDSFNDWARQRALRAGKFSYRPPAKAVDE
ncbi:hypothetical protein F4778DRAFT_788360 [Xylariomycetidae sp. FL2044]|nr:hypothetical protein F4778DRAFT_788360 [Xylariomycetidae sp. FL2044]